MHSLVAVSPTAVTPPASVSAATKAMAPATKAVAAATAEGRVAASPEAMTVEVRSALRMPAAKEAMPAASRLAESTVLKS